MTTATMVVREVEKVLPRSAIQVILPGGVVYDSLAVVKPVSRRCLVTKGWVIWRYPLLDGVTFVVRRDAAVVTGYPDDLPVLTLDGDVEKVLREQWPDAL